MCLAPTCSSAGPSAKAVGPRVIRHQPVDVADAMSGDIGRLGAGGTLGRSRRSRRPRSRSTQSASDRRSAMDVVVADRRLVVCDAWLVGVGSIAAPAVTVGNAAELLTRRLDGARTRR